MLLFGTQVTQNSRYSGGVHPQECVPTESWWVVGWCGRLSYLLDCRFCAYGECQNLICSALKSLQSVKFQLHKKPKECVRASRECGLVW